MLIQSKNGYRFSTDSVLLANFAKIKKSDVYLDLCTGSGVVAILAVYKNKPKQAYAVEIQSRLASSAKRSVSLNGLDIEVLEQDLKDTPKTLGFESVDVITVNPPYNRETPKMVDEFTVATNEVKTNLKEIVKVSSKLLRFGGKFYVCIRSDRLADLIYELKSCGLEPKRLVVVYPKLSKEPNLVLVEAKKGANSGIKILKPLILMNEDNTETSDLKNIYNRKNNS